MEYIMFCVTTDIDKVQEVRQQIPTTQQKQSDLYDITDLSNK